MGLDLVFTNLLSFAIQMLFVEMQQSRNLWELSERAVDKLLWGSEVHIYPYRASAWFSTPSTPCSLLD